jgi:PHP family Zn ribbon phosphoesterase
MEVNVDLHSHSGYAGGVGNIDLAEIAASMVKKGLHIFGTGDALHPDWNAHLKRTLSEAQNGLFMLRNASGELANVRFLLQTEVILTGSVKTCPGRKSVHILILFPSFAAVEKVTKLFLSWGSRNTIGRPFVRCADSASVSEKVKRLYEIDGVELIPAHVMTPQGIYGSDHPVVFLSDFFGESAKLFRAVETGLSADPLILHLIPELDRMTLLSFSDCHSAASNRLGREFTTLSVGELSYSEIISAIRTNRVSATAEFNPGEGRYFLTGHRKDKQNHNGSYCVFSPEFTPPDRRCPICRRPLTVGVLERAIEVGKAQGEKRKLIRQSDRTYLSIVPLSEVIAYSLCVEDPNARRVKEIYEKIVALFETESALWKSSVDQTEKILSNHLPENIVRNIIEVKSGNFTFDPLGFDGEYGRLAIGKKDNWFGTNMVSAKKESHSSRQDLQKNLFC